MLQPAGYQAFPDSYTSLAKTTADGWQVSFVENKEDIPEEFRELGEHHKFVKLHFGAK